MESHSYHQPSYICLHQYPHTTRDRATHPDLHSRIPQNFAASQHARKLSLIQVHHVQHI
jgi:hypothetical protein